MKAEQFVYGLFDHYGIKLIKSPGLNDLLTGENIDYLCKLEKPKEYSNLWPNGVITVTRISHAKDEYGRDGVWNHTIAVRLMDYLAYVQPSKALNLHFVDRLDEPPKELKPIEIEK